VESGIAEDWGTTETRKSESMADGPTAFIHAAPDFSGAKRDANLRLVLSQIGTNLRL